MMIRMGFRAVWSLVFLAALGVLQGCGGYGGGAAGGAGGSAGGPGGGGTGGGGGGGGAPGSGWLVAQRFELDRQGIDVLPLDATGGTPVGSVAGAVVVGAIPGVGIAYGRGAAALGFAEVGFFREGDAQRVVLGNEAGHSYAFVTDPTSATPFLASGRLMISERTEISGVSLLSFAADGGDPRKLTNSACAGIFGARMRPGGIAYACDPEASYFSDGFATAVPLGPNAALAIPLEIATVGSRKYVILQTALSRLITMPADGSNTFASLSPDPSGTDVLLAMAGSTALVTTTISGTDHATYTVSADGSSRKVRNAGGAGPAVSGSPRVTPDQGHFLVIYRDDVGNQSRAFLVPADPDDDVSIGLPTPSGPASALEATQFADGTLLVRLEGVGYRTVSAAGDPGPLLESATDIHRVDAGSFAVFQSPAAPHPMKAVRLDGTETVLLTETGDGTRPPVVSPGGRIFFLDGNGRPWVAAPDLGLRTPIDGIPADALQLTGGDGIREFVAVRRVTGDRATFVVHTDTGQVESLPGGTADVVGWFLP